MIYFSDKVSLMIGENGRHTVHSVDLLINKPSRTGCPASGMQTEARSTGVAPIAVRLTAHGHTREAMCYHGYVNVKENFVYSLIISYLSR